jgi:16S rRNA (cytosine1402-N4)-methyltransferase
VNDELRRLRDGLPKLIDVLKPGGRIAVISFHSLEDRIVKNCFRAESRATKAQMGFGESQEKPARLRVVNKDLVAPSKDEVERNPRARSAKLRIAERI